MKKKFSLFSIITFIVAFFGIAGVICYGISTNVPEELIDENSVMESENLDEISNEELLSLLDNEELDLEEIELSDSEDDDELLYEDEQ